MKEIIIIGIGPSGITAAIYLKRAGFNPFVIGKDYGILNNNFLIENYYGFAEPVKSKDLIVAGINQAKNLNIDVKIDSVISIKDHVDYFEVITENSTFKTMAILLATGKNRDNVPIKGLKDFLGKGISLCATCDGYFYRQKNIALIGSGEYLKHELLYLENITKNIIIFTNGEELSFETSYKTITEPIELILGNDKANAIKTAKDKYNVDGIFVAVGSPSSYEFSSQLGIIVENGHIVVDENYATNIPGIFASGDIIGGKLQIAKAVYDGVEVTDSIIEYIKNKMA